ncbi:tetratricopeptide repeat protein [Vallitaleaceae bacterium 9-2]
MDFIKKKWRIITLGYLLISYLTFIVYMDKRTDYLTYAGIAFLVVTLILFIGTFIGLFGIILHTLFKKEHAAMPFYRMAYTLGTTNINILAAYGVLLIKTFKPDEALGVFEKALKLTTNYLYTKTLTGNIALCHWKMGNEQKALTTYEELFYFPDLETITDFSEENLEEGKSKNGNFYAQDFVTMGYLALINNQLDKASYYTQVALELSESYGPAYDNLGQIAYAHGNLEQAKEHFMHALELKPGMIDSMFFLAQIAWDEGNKDAAQNQLNAMDISRVNGLSTVSIDRINELKTKSAS